MTMHERIMAGKLFTDMCGGMPAERLTAKKLMKRFNDSEPDDAEGRVRLLGEIFGKPCGSWIEPPFYFCYGTHISLGKDCYINVNCSFIDDGKITIGDAVMFGPGVTIGDNTVIGAGSVLTKDIPANCVATGNPCRVLREINEHDMKYYYRDRLIDEADLEEERRLRGAE